jgi:hypothetical protein
MAFVWHLRSYTLTSGAAQLAPVGIFVRKKVEQQLGRLPMKGSAKLGRVAITAALSFVDMTQKFMESYCLCPPSS